MRIEHDEYNERNTEDVVFFHFMCRCSTADPTIMTWLYWLHQMQEAVTAKHGRFYGIKG